MCRLSLNLFTQRCILLQVVSFTKFQTATCHRSSSVRRFARVLWCVYRRIIPSYHNSARRLEINCLASGQTKAHNHEWRVSAPNFWSHYRAWCGQEAHSSKNWTKLLLKFENIKSNQLTKLLWNFTGEWYCDDSEWHNSYLYERFRGWTLC